MVTYISQQQRQRTWRSQMRREAIPDASPEVSPDRDRSPRGRSPQRQRTPSREATPTTPETSPEAQRRSSRFVARPLASSTPQANPVQLQVQVQTPEASLRTSMMVMMANSPDASGFRGFSNSTPPAERSRAIRPSSVPDVYTAPETTGTTVHTVIQPAIVPPPPEVPLSEQRIREIFGEMLAPIRADIQQLRDEMRRGRAPGPSADDGQQPGTSSDPVRPVRGRPNRRRPSKASRPEVGNKR